MKITPAKALKIQLEYNAVVEALKRTNFNQGSAANILGITRRTIYNRIRRHNKLTGQQKEDAMNMVK